MNRSAAGTYVIQGQEVRMPVEVRDASNATALYLVPADAAQALLPGDVFEVIDAGGGMAQLILGLIDYRDNDLGNYNEIAVIFFVKPRGADADATGTFIYKLPVNQSLSCEAGCSIWGFPKTVDQCDFTYGEGTLTGVLTMDGRHVLTLQVPCDAPDDGDEGALQDSVTYTYIADVPQRTALTQGGPTTVQGGDRVTLELGDHPLADDLRSLGLPAPAMMCTWTPRMRGTFGPAEPI